MATFTNQATLTYSGGTANSNITTGQLLEVLTASKTAVVPTYRTGRPITYLITLINSGAAALTGLTVTDDLGGYVFNGNTVYPLTYTFVIQNTGNTAAAAADTLAVTDTFDPILRDLTVTLNGTALTTPAQYTYDAATGRFATVAGVITVPAAAYAQDTATGLYTVTPGTATLTVTGTI